jgi:hypothetical protein
MQQSVQKRCNNQSVRTVSAIEHGLSANAIREAICVEERGNSLDWHSIRFHPITPIPNDTGMPGTAA